MTDGTMPPPPNATNTVGGAVRCVLASTRRPADSAASQERQAGEGVAVANPIHRHAPVLAAAWMACALVAFGWLGLGIGPLALAGLIVVARRLGVASSEDQHGSDPDADRRVGDLVGR